MMELSLQPSLLVLATVTMMLSNSRRVDAFQSLAPSATATATARIAYSCSPIRRQKQHQMTFLDISSEVDSSISLLTQLDTFWQNDPYTAAALVCGFKASAADLVAQQSALSSPDSSMDSATARAPPAPEASSTTDASSLPCFSWIDTKRNMAFLLYGSLYQGMVHEYVFNHLYPVWFGTGCDMSVVLTKVVFNLLVQTTLVTLPVAYLLKAVIMDSTTTTDANPLDAALQKYLHDIQYQGLLTKAFALWGPVQCLTFSVVPEHYRVTFIAVVSFFWLIVLSSISSNDSNTVSTPSQTQTQQLAKEWQAQSTTVARPT